MVFANVSRRDWLKHAALLGAAVVTGSMAGGRIALGQAGGATSAPAAVPPAVGGAAKARMRAALTAGDNRGDNIMKALKPFEKEIAQAIGSRHVVIKPNNVSTDNQLSATHADCIAAILEFLKSIGKLEGAVIAESPANGSAMVGFDHFKYPAVASKYGVKLVDLDAEGSEVMYVIDENDFRPHAVPMAKMLLDPNAFIISTCKPKTHDRVVATLTLKNIVVGAATKAGSRNGKPIIHGGGFRGINYNLFTLAQRLHPQLSVIDGFEGMEGNGPVGGRQVDHRICIVSPDWYAADRLAVELMGIDFAKVGYLNFWASAGFGDADVKKIELIGEEIAPHVKPYKMADNINQQLIWMKPVKG